MTRFRLLIGIVIGPGLALGAAACGNPPGSHVAQLGSTTTRRATGSAMQGAVAFTGCMRSHGVPAYPDPATGGRLVKTTPQQLGVSSSAFQTAERACIHLVPTRGEPTEAQIEQYRNAMLVYARCLRATGVADMPDPDDRGHVDIGPGTGVDVNSPRFQAAYQVCKGKLAS